MHIIFDFDGTIVDSFTCVIDTFNFFSDRYRYKKIETQDIPLLRDLTSRELVMHLGIPLYKIPFLIRAARKHMHRSVPTLKPIDDIIPVIKQLYQSGVSLGIVTSNSEENVTRWLQQHALLPLFHYIYIESNFFSKKHVLNKIIDKYSLNKASVYYIGDETRDIDAAKQCRIFSMAVTWGFNSEKILTQQQPHFIAHEPQDILSLLKIS